MKYVIIGAGIAGLTAAHQLLKKGHEVLILEKESDIGGLSRSFRYGGFIFDIGPHRFFTSNHEVDEFIGSVLKEDRVVINRMSSVYLLNRYFSWPLAPDALLKFPPHLLFKVVFDLFLGTRQEDQDFRSSAIGRYGKTLFELVFRDYTEKFCHIPCEKLHSNWIKVSLEKTIINKNIKMDSLVDLFKMPYKSIRARTRFLYPTGGCGKFTQNLGRMISDKGGIIIRNTGDIFIGSENDRITSLRYAGADKATAGFGHIIYTAPITQIIKQLNLGTVDLEYLNSIIYNIEINKPLARPEQWIYFGDSDLIFVRVSFPKNFHKDNVPPGKDSLCVEVTCRGDSVLWNNPGFIRQRLAGDLAKAKLCRREDIGEVHIEKIANTYPIYKLNYLEELKAAQNKLSKFCNLTFLGRSGTFWYNNMDESIESALKLTDRIK
jgi:protoporphyrinogen oxidase